MPQSELSRPSCKHTATSPVCQKGAVSQPRTCLQSTREPRAVEIHCCVFVVGCKKCLQLKALPSHAHGTQTTCQLSRLQEPHPVARPSTHAIPTAWPPCLLHMTKVTDNPPGMCGKDSQKMPQHHATPVHKRTTDAGCRTRREPALRLCPHRRQFIGVRH